MDYVQVFCGVLAAAYFIWVAKSWWNTDVDVLLFQRKVCAVLFAALVLIFTYTYGVLAGGGAVIDTVVEAAHIDTSKVVVPTDVVPSKPSRLDKVLVPNWVTFYVFVLLGEISLAITMPQRKRTHGHAGVEQERAEHKGPGTDPGGAS